MKCRSLIIGLLLGSGLLAFAQEPKVKVLIVEGVSNHDWRHRVEIVRAILAKDGSFDVTVTVTPSTAGDPAWATWRPDFSKYDVVMSGYNNLGGKPQWPAEVQAAFTNYVKSGGGFYAYHEANNSFSEWSEYNKIIGLGWRDVNFGTGIIVNPDETLQYVPPGGGTSTSHGSRVNVLVKRMNNHPIHQGLPMGWMAADIEIYRYARGPATNLTVMSYAKDPTTQLQFPIEWAVQYGQGRAFISSYGHVWADQTQPTGTRCVAFQTIMVRALKWLAKRDPGNATPADFPTTNAISLRPYAKGVSGLDQAQAVGAFANGKLPTQSTPPGSVLIQPAFTNQLWESPVEAKPWPGSSDLLIAEMDGRLFRVPNNDATTNRTLVLDIQDRAWYYNWTVGNTNTKHGGVQSLAFHPRFGLGEGKDYLYMFYVHHATDNPDAGPPYYDRLVRFTWNPTNSTFNPASELIMVNQYDTVKGHDGGGMAFGADGFLYISIGDEGTQDGASTPHTQKINDRVRSGTWRLDVDQKGGSVSHAIRRQPVNAQPGHGSYTQGYFVPNDNPWLDPGGGVLEEFYSLGLRNPFRMSYDPVTGLFWIGDVGGGAREEIDVLDAPMLNFQWNYKEGTANGFRSMPSPLIGIDRGPVHDYSHSVGSCVIMGYVYRGNAIPWLQGRVLFGDNGTQKIYALKYDPVTKQLLSVTQIGTGPSGSLFSGLSSITHDSQGEPLLLKLGGSGSGRISRIKPDPGLVDNSRFPTNLAATGLFTNLSTLAPAPGLIPYEVNMPLWSAGADKQRWLMIPNDGTPDTAAEQITYNDTGSWVFPVGSVLVKHFGKPDGSRKLETRVLVRGNDGGWGGVTYRWLPDESDAVLQEDGSMETLTIEGDTVQYLYPSRSQCTICHTPLAGPLLGLRTRQLDRRITYPATGRSANQVETLSALGLLNSSLTEVDLIARIKSAPIEDATISNEYFVRSYLDANCSHCHQPGANQAVFDARLTTAFANQNLICGAVHNPLGLASPAVIKPGQLDKSVMFRRMNMMDECCSMPPLAKGRIDQQAVTRMANWILGMTPDSCTQGGGGGSSQAVGLGNGNTPNAGSVDSWKANMVVNETDTYTNLTGAPLILNLQRFQFHATRVTDPLTPFVVRVNGDNNFTVLAIGTPRSSYAAGPNDFPFADASAQLTLAAGEVIGIGFLDALPDGSGGTQNGAVTYVGGTGTDQIHYSGGSSDGNSGSVTVGQPPVFGSTIYTTFGRDYFFTITFQPAGNLVALGNGTVPGSSPNVDSWKANMVINESDVYTNTSGAPLVVSPQRFQFHATRVTDPLTPFLVRINGDNQFTVLAVGTPRAAYVAGANDFAFSDTATTVTLSSGERLGIGFLDALPNGTGGTSNGAVTYVSGAGTDQIHYSGGTSDANSGSVTAGQPPVFGTNIRTDFGRNYHFSITMLMGGTVVDPDSDSDGLPDSWELVFASSLTTFSAGADYDGDGLTDAGERAAGTDPTDPASRFQVRELRPQPGTTNLLAAFDSVPGRDYQLWVTHDFTTWTERGNIRSADWPATTTSVQLGLAELPAGANQRLFLRASIVGQQP